MLRRILSLVLNYNGRLEDKGTKKQSSSALQRHSTPGSEKSGSGTYPKRNQTQVPDPWD